MNNNTRSKVHTKCDKNSYSELFEFDDITYGNPARLDKTLHKRYGSQMIDGWFEKQVVKLLCQ
jgi:hypothetical protein